MFQQYLEIYKFIFDAHNFPRNFITFCVGWTKSQLLAKHITRDMDEARSTLTCQAWVGHTLEVTRRAYKLLAVLIKSSSEAGVG